MFPFILLGRVIAIIKPLKAEYRVFYFFPFYHTGGAEKIHIQLTKATGGKDCIIFFTRKSEQAHYLEAFKETGCTIRDISTYTDNKWLYFLNLIWRGRLSGYINKQKNTPIVFNGQCNLGYKISPWINHDVPQIELIHALNTFSWIRIPFLPFYNASVTVSDEIIAKHKTLYAPLHVPEKYFGHFKPVFSRVPLPPRGSKKDYHKNPLTVLYVGRTTPDKRHWLFARLAGKMQNPEHVRFEMAGVESAWVDAPYQSAVFCHGDVRDEDLLYRIYDNAHILVIPSSTESGPLVFMEAMARGLAIVSTPVGYIPGHIRDGEEGFVCRELVDEDKVLEEMTAFITKLENDRALLEKIGIHNTDRAYELYNIDSFNRDYLALFESFKTRN